MSEPWTCLYSLTAQNCSVLGLSLCLAWSWILSGDHYYAIIIFWCGTHSLLTYSFLFDRCTCITMFILSSMGIGFIYHNTSMDYSQLIYCLFSNLLWLWLKDFHSSKYFLAFPRLPMIFVKCLQCPRALRWALKQNRHSHFAGCMYFPQVKQQSV